MVSSIFRLKPASIERLKDDTSSVSSRGSLDNKIKTIINIETASSQDGFIDDSIENMLADGQDNDEKDGVMLDMSKEVADIMKDKKDGDQEKASSNDTLSLESDSDSEREPVHIEVESISNDCNVSRQFIDLLFSTVHIKGESRLAQEVLLPFFLISLCV